MKKSLVLIFVMINCTFMIYSQVDNDVNNMSSLYFENPEKAIPEIRELLEASDWKTLSRYYDLRDSDIKIKELLSGDFFIRTEKPEVVHPGGFWKYKHPFPPAFNYQHDTLINDSIYEIVMSLEIDQGEGMMQKGIQNFYMIKSDDGFQILAGSEYE